MRAKYGYLGKMLFVNLSDGKIQEEDLSEDLAKDISAAMASEQESFMSESSPVWIPWVPITFSPWEPVL